MAPAMMAARARTPTTTPAAMPPTLGPEELEDAVAEVESLCWVAGMVTTTVVPGATEVTMDGTTEVTGAATTGTKIGVVVVEEAAVIAKGVGVVAVVAGMTAAAVVVDEGEDGDEAESPP